VDENWGNLLGSVAVSAAGRIAHGTAASPTPELDPAPRHQLTTSPLGLSLAEGKGLLAAAQST
jgi:hypothetical protein